MTRLTDVAPGREIRPRSIFCVNEHAYRDRRVAEEVCAGRFTHCGVTLELGVEPDWLGAPLPPDEEWEIDWNKFYYGRDLASAFRDTGERRFLTAWERLLGSWIQQVPVGSDDTDVAARRIQNWVYAWDLFASAPAFPGLREGLADELLQSLAAQARYIRRNLTPQRNHRTLELYALFCVALALDLDGELLDFSIAELHRNLVEEVRPDGVHIEASTHYHLVVLRSFLGLRENARRFGLQLPAGFDERLVAACEFALHCHRPDGEIPATSDADAGAYPELLAMAATLLERPDFLYGSTEGRQGVRPSTRYASFPDGGYFIQRSGWGDNGTAFGQERFLIFDCGPLGAGGHGHYDLLSVEVAAGGRPLLIDPGRYTYAEHEPAPGTAARNMRHWFKGTAGHNTVCVDGLDQTPYAPKKPKGAIAKGRLLERSSTPGLDVVRGEATSPCYEAVHRRRVVFVGDEYWILEDELRGERPHRYDLRFHLAPEAQGEMVVERAAERSLVRAPGLALVLDPRLELRLEPGWFAPLYGVRRDAPVLSAALDGATDALLLTLVVPLEMGRPAPTLRLLQRDGDGGTVVEVKRAGPDSSVRDLVAWSPSPRPLELGAVDCVARAAWLREHPSGEPLAFRACDLTDATRRGT